MRKCVVLNIFSLIKILVNNQFFFPAYICLKKLFIYSSGQYVRKYQNLFLKFGNISIRLPFKSAIYIFNINKLISL